MRSSFAMQTGIWVIAAMLPGQLGAQGPSQQRQPEENAWKIPVDRGAGSTWQALKKLQTRASLLMIVAHPDDEDGGTLTYESRGLGARTDLLTLNRGEGGANVMSADLWDALGLVRTEELLQSGRYYGLDGQYFTTVADYGFSKSLEEAIEKWGHDRVLEQAVRVVRETRPLIVCSVFVGGPTDGHGNHATAGLMAQEVFKAAGDPNMFPEQLKEGLLPWTPLKVYARTPFFRISDKGSYDYANHSWGPVGVTNHVTGKWEPGPVETTVSIPSGSYDPVLGESYVQISREGLGFQKSQGGGPEIPLIGPQSANYHRFGSHIEAQQKEQSFFDGVDVSFTGIADLAGANPPAWLTQGLGGIDRQITKATQAFTSGNSTAVATELAEGMKQTEALLSRTGESSLGAEAKYNIAYELRVKRRQFNDALVSALGIAVDADVVPATEPNLPAEFRRTQTTFQMAIPGQNIRVKVHVFQAGTADLSVQDLKLVPSSGKPWALKVATGPYKTLVSGTAFDAIFTATVPEDEPFTRPYFTRAGLEDAYYKVAPGAPLNAPASDYPLAAEVSFSFYGVNLQIRKGVQVVSRVVGPGTLRYPMPVGPAVSVALSPSAGIVPLGTKSFAVSVRLHNNVDGAANENVHLDIPSGWRSEPSSAPVNFTQAGQDQTVAFTIYPQVEDGKHYELTAVADYGGTTYREGYVVTGYSGLRPYFLYSAAKYETTGTEVRMAPGETIGYIEGSGDDVPASLEALGVHVAFLSAQDLASGDLSKYDEILVGVRAYAVRQDLIANNDDLLRYVKNGGVVVVQYNTPEYDHNFGPYPYVMTNDPEEVTDEASKMTILAPANPVFTWPNQITTRDFDGWIEERGSKFLQSWDPRYEALLETHDKGQPEQKGGLVYARYGKGVYVYNAYAFYRQLPLGVPGAYRIFANLLSLPKNPHLRESN
jgi:LmbE family N-acetylglucosaminyl deacetylase